MSRDFKIIVLVLCILAAIAFVYIQFGPGVTRQQKNLKVAVDSLPRVEAIINSDKRYRNVSAFVYTGQDGAIGLQGTVNSDDDLFNLMKAVSEQRLPVTISWQVRVVPSSGQ